MTAPVSSLLLPGVTLLVLSLVTGAMFGIWRGYDPTGYSPNTFVEVQQGAIRGLNFLMPALGGVATAGAILLAFDARRRGPVFALYLAAVIFLVVAALVTRFGNQPINAIVMDWTSAPPSGWEALRDRWWAWHQIRLVAGVAAEMLLVGAILLDRPGALDA
jgi:hypothetical protein